MQHVGAAFRRDIENSAGPTAKFSAVGIGLDAEFAHGFSAQKLS